MVKRIACIGAHGTGKNTLCINLLNKAKSEARGLNAIYMPETVRTTMFMDHNVLAKEIGGNVNSIEWLYHKHWSQIREFEYSADLLIVKRLPLDYVIYSEIFTELGMMRRPLGANHLFAAVEFTDCFDEVYFVRPEPQQAMAVDMIRQGPAGDEKSRLLMDERYAEIIENCGVRITAAGTYSQLVEKLAL